MNQYLELVRLQKETSGATFTMGYSTRSNKHYVFFNNTKNRFESEDVNICMNNAINWIIKTRKQSKVTDYTLYN